MHPLNQSPRSYAEVHVFGGKRYGESIVLKLPDGSFGVVDSCLDEELNGARRNPVAEYLKSRGVSELRFLCLTHPHRDHFEGMLRLFTEFRPKQFWHPANTSAKFIASLIKRLKLPALEVNAFASLDALDELEKLYFAVSARMKDSRIRRLPFQCVSVVMNLSLLEVPAVGTFKAIAPHGNDIQSFQDRLQSAFTPDGSLRPDLPDEKFNKISIALLIAFKKFQIILCGDVENASWQLIRRDCLTEDWRSRLFKVSHHGSAGAFCKKLSDAVFGNVAGTESVLTGFSSSHLPRQSVVHELKSLSKSVAITHRVHLQTRTDSPATESRRVLGQTFGIPSQQSSRSRGLVRSTFMATSQADSTFAGRCSYHFDREGRLVHTEIVGPATWI